MPTKLDVTITPADFEALSRRDLSQLTCVVFDVLRATSSMITALANGAAGILPAGDIPEALAIRQGDRDALLAGERQGVRILADLTGSIDFDLGNSPREFSPEKVKGKTIIMTTTNGTRAIRACDRAQRVFISSFLNLSATAARLRSVQPNELLLVCGGTFEEAAYEDVLAAGALADLLWPLPGQGMVSDSALLARTVYQAEKGNLVDALATSRNGQRLMNNPELRADVPCCSQSDKFDIVGRVSSGGVVVREV